MTSVSELVSRYASDAGLRGEMPPFPQAGSLSTRLARLPVLMAPMAGVSDASWRIMSRAGGAPLAYTEMISVAGFAYNSAKTLELAMPHDAEPDIAVQLFGSKPEQFEAASGRIFELVGKRLVLIDVNMACPVPKVTKKGEGAALLDRAERAQDIVRACRSGVGDRIPVTAKIRVGRSPDSIVGPHIARCLESAGVAAIAVHGRTSSQLYRGTSNPAWIAQVVQAVDVPVIASGDIHDEYAALTTLEKTGAQAVFVARGSYGNPWIFARTYSLMAGIECASPTMEQRIAALEMHIRIMDATGAHLARGRSVAAHYLKGFPAATRLREAAYRCLTLDDYLALCSYLREMLVKATDEPEEPLTNISVKSRGDA